MRYRRGFTLIELLVIIVVISILATIVVTLLDSARVKARNANAKSDITEIGKAIESFKNDDSVDGQVIGAATLSRGLFVAGASWSNAAALSITDSSRSSNQVIKQYTAAGSSGLGGGATVTTVTQATWTNIFSGTTSFRTPSSYGVSITGTPGSQYTYIYYTAKSGPIAQQYNLLGPHCYIITTNVDNTGSQGDNGFGVQDGVAFSNTGGNAVAPSFSMPATVC